MQDADSRQDMYMGFYEEVCRRTAQLVAGWQCIGFCHGQPSQGPLCGRTVLMWCAVNDSEVTHDVQRLALPVLVASGDDQG